VSYSIPTLIPNCNVNQQTVLPKLVWSTLADTSWSCIKEASKTYRSKKLWIDDGCWLSALNVCTYV
jgi:hypothetical protein